MRIRHRAREAVIGLLPVFLTAVGCASTRRPEPEIDPFSDPTPLLASCRQFQHGDGYLVRVTFLDLDFENLSWGPDGGYVVEVLRGDEVRARWRTHDDNPFGQHEGVLYRVEYSPMAPIGAPEDQVIAFDLEAGRERWRAPIPPSGSLPEGGWSFYSARVALNPAHPRGIYVETVDHNGRTGWFLDRATGAVVAGPLRAHD